MKNANARFSGQRLLGAAVLLCAALAVAVSAQISGYKDGYCELRLAGCPQEYNGAELKVPLNVVALSTHIRACKREDAVETAAAPAVMFIIDHSTTMQSNPGNDVSGNRFRVTKALIDSIYAKAPNAEVGVVIFANGLVFNATRDSNLVNFTGIVDDSGGIERRKSQAYLPLMQLDQSAKSGGSAPFTTAANPKAIDVLRGMFTVSNTNRGSITGGPTEISGTDITIAFEAALEAFQKSTKSKDNQYIIFLSDGDPIIYTTGANGTITGGALSPSQRCTATNTGSGFTTGPTPNATPPNPRCSMLLDFENGALNGAKFPTTYTVYLRAADDGVPPSISKMTENVKINGYSATNPKSNAWALKSNFSELLSLMMEEIVSPMLKTSDASAKSIVVTSTSVSGGLFDSTGNMDGNFNFKRPLPLDTGEVTTIEMGIRYDVQIDSINTITGDTVKLIVKDSLIEYKFSVRRSASPPAGWLDEHNLDEDCKNAPTLDLRFGGASLIGREVKGNMAELEIVFDNAGGLFNYSAVKVQVLNADGSVSDVEDYSLKNEGNGKWTYTFPRIVSETAAKGDGTLQHAGQDSIILVFRNPDVKLDTIRVAVPYVSNAMAFYDAPGDPANGNKLPDVDTLVAGQTLDIYAKLFDSNGWDSAMTADAGKIKWTVAGSPAVALITDGDHCVFRTETAGGTYTVTATYTSGAMVIKKDIVIKVVPGPAVYIEAVPDSAKINFGRVADTAYLKGNKEYTFERDVDRAVFYAVRRDVYGNYIDLAAGSDWSAIDEKNPNKVPISAEPRGDASSATVTRRGSTFSDYLYVVVENDGLADTVRIRVVGEPAAAVGPNPFVPGSSPVMDRLEKLDLSGNLVELYRPIAANSKSGGGNGNADNANGVLVTATAPRPVKPNGSGGAGSVSYAAAKAVIYDAVGHVVFESKPGDIVMADDGSTFGFVWNGKNMKGRKVGPGTYAMRMTATMTNGEKYAVQRMIGVTISK